MRPRALVLTLAELLAISRKVKELTAIRIER
jgi:hypothetical protein